MLRKISRLQLIHDSTIQGLNSRTISQYFTYNNKNIIVMPIHVRQEFVT